VAGNGPCLVWSNGRSRVLAFGILGVLLAMLAAGKLASRVGLLGIRGVQTLNLLLLYVCLPASVLRNVPGMRYSVDLTWIVLLPWLLMGGNLVVVTLLGRALKLDRQVRAVLTLCVPLGNTSFLGYPLVTAFFGSSALPCAIVYDQFGTFLILSTAGVVILARASGEATPRAREVVLRILRFPPLIALAVALTVMPTDMPGVIDDSLRILSETLLPLAALSIGTQLDFRLPLESRPALLLGLAIKLAIMPAIAMFFSARASLDPVQTHVVVVESAMPPMVTAAALAVSHRLAPSFAAGLVGYGTLLSLVTLPMWVLVVRT